MLAPSFLPCRPVATGPSAVPSGKTRRLLCGQEFTTLASTLDSHGTAQGASRFPFSPWSQDAGPHAHRHLRQAPHRSPVPASSPGTRRCSSSHTPSEFTPLYSAMSTWTGRP